MSSESGPKVPLCEPHLGGREAEYVGECIATNWVSSVGPFVGRFESMVAEAAGTRHAVATVNGTSALHVALLVAGVRPGDEVLVSTFTFIAPVNAICYAGARPVFLDAEEASWQMDTQKLERFLREQCNPGPVRKSTGRRVAAILPVDVFGHPADRDRITALAAEFGLPVVEDATEALGARYRDQPVGAGVDVACFSFNGNKIITTGGGGMIVTDRTAWADRARHLTTQAKEPGVEYIHRDIGFNYRLSNMHAAMGCAQMERLGEHVAAKRRIARRYLDGLAGVAGISFQAEAPGCASTWWLFTIRVDARRFGCDSRALLGRLAAAGIQSRPAWQPNHRSPAHEGCEAFECEVADRLFDEALSLPSSVGLREEDQGRVIRVIRDAARG